MSAFPIVSGKIQALQEEFSEIFPECEVTRSQMKQTEEEVAESVHIEEDSGIWLFETLFNCLIEEKGECLKMLSLADPR